MCGIAGYFYYNGGRICDTGNIIRMLEIQKHRGPDDSGIRAISFQNQQSEELSTLRVEAIDTQFDCVVGFNRLSILDLSRNGHQPMCTEDGKVILAFNGEIYNAFDYKRQLMTEGVVFESSTDTEVILHLYRKYGFEEMVKRLNGMFSIVMVDLNTASIYVARDRFGIKPIYMYERNGVIAFSSEIKSLLHLPTFECILNDDLLDEYLLFRNNVNATLFRGVSCLTPGYYYHFSFTTKIATLTKYFDVDNLTRVVSGTTSIHESVQSLTTCLRKSVERQLISDVRLGCQLSGGVDSSLITFLAQDLNKRELLETISVVLEDPYFNEERYIDEASATLGVKSHKCLLDASYYLDSFEKVTWHFEGPINHPNTIGIFFLSENAKRYVTVLLSGEGADEIFGGYDRFSMLLRPFTPYPLLSGLKKNVDTPFSFLGNYASSAYRSIIASAYMTEGVARQVKRSFNLERALQNRLDIFEKLSGSRFDKQVKYELKTYLPDLLVRQDKMSMAHSIENRVPFLDNEVLEMSFSIPQEFLVPTSGAGRKNKYLLKMLASSVFGVDFAFREKQGFGIPLRRFFSDRNFASYINDEVIPAAGRDGIFNDALLKKWVANVGRVSSNELNALWIIIAFQVWMKKFSVS